MPPITGMDLYSVMMALISFGWIALDLTTDRRMIMVMLVMMTTESSLEW